MKKTLFITFCVAIIVRVIFPTEMVPNNSTQEHLLNGLWTTISDKNGMVHNYKFNNGHFESLNDDNIVSSKGTYVIINDNITFNVTHVRGYGDNSDHLLTREEMLEYHSELLQRVANFPNFGKFGNPLEAMYNGLYEKFAVNENVLQLSYPLALDLELFDGDLDKYLENSKHFRNQVITDEWVTQNYTRVTQ